MPKTKIFQVVAKTPRWGFDLAREIAQALHDDGHEVITLFMNGEYDAKVASSYPGKTIFPAFKHKKPWWRLIALFTLIRICAQHRFQYVLSHHYKPSSIMAIVDRLFRFKKIHMLNHNPGNLRRQGRVWIIRWLFSARWHYLGVSQWVVDDFIQHAPFIRQDTTHVLYNCLDINKVIEKQQTAETARQHFHLSKTDFVFGNIHRLDPSKGHDYMIRAFAQVADRMPTAKLVIIGGGKRQTLLENLADELGMGDRIHLAGMIPDASAYATGFDAFISPSLHEGFGLGLLEGMAARLPTITSTGGASPEVVGDSGLQFPPGDTNALAEAMLKLYRLDAQAREAMGNASLNRLTHCFSKETYHKNVKALFSGINQA